MAQWETLYRERLQLERTLTVSEAPEVAGDGRGERPEPPEAAIGLAFVVLVAADLAASLAAALRARQR